MLLRLIEIEEDIRNLDNLAKKVEEYGAKKTFREFLSEFRPKSEERYSKYLQRIMLAAIGYQLIDDFSKERCKKEKLCEEAMYDLLTSAIDPAESFGGFIESSDHKEGRKLVYEFMHMILQEQQWQW